ncbi:unnamed protein product [Paramecium sonneborni]|uniref:Uncharacterized protein n=1 Tax=Paramecium sonneborni TaxID=65129 RepID=A0A8S1MYI7_9CILI|nr:unnamed protein product [Paramecium sonneborni]
MHINNRLNNLLQNVVSNHQQILRKFIAFHFSNYEERASLLVGDESRKDMPYTTEATIRTHYLRLSKFVKHAYYIIIDAQLQMMQNSVEDIVKQVLEFNEQYKESSGRKRKEYYSKDQPYCWIIIEAIGKQEEIFLILQENNYSEYLKVQLLIVLFVQQLYIEKCYLCRNDQVYSS